MQSTSRALARVLFGTLVGAKPGEPPDSKINGVESARCAALRLIVIALHKSAKQKATGLEA